MQTERLSNYMCLDSDYSGMSTHPEYIVQLSVQWILTHLLGDHLKLLSKLYRPMSLFGQIFLETSLNSLDSATD